MSWANCMTADNKVQRGGACGQENLKEALDCRGGQPGRFCKMDIVLDGIILLIRLIFKAFVPQVDSQ